MSLLCIGIFFTTISLDAQSRIDFARHWQKEYSAKSIEGLHLLLKYRSLSGLRNGEEKIGYFDQVIELSDHEQFMGDSILADLYVWRGLELGQARRYSEAVESLLPGLYHYKQLYPDSNYLIHSTYFHLAEKSYLSHQYEESALYCDSAILCQWPYEKGSNWPRTTMLKARLMGLAGDLGRAEQYMNVTWPYQQYYRSHQQLYFDLCAAGIYRDLFMPDKVLDLLLPYAEQGISNDILSNMVGQAFFRKEDYSRALQYHDEVLALARQRGEVQEWMRANRAGALSHLGRAAEALEYYRSVDHEELGLEGKLRHFVSLAETYADASLTDSALFHDFELFDLVQAEKGKFAFLASSYYANTVSHIEQHLEVEKFDIAKTIEFIDTATQSLARLRYLLPNQVARQNFAGNYRRFFDHAIRILGDIAQGSAENASQVLECMERTKSQVLYDEAWVRQQLKSQSLDYRRQYNSLQDSMKMATGILDSFAVSDTLFYWLEEDQQDSSFSGSGTISAFDIRSVRAEKGLLLEYFEHVDSSLSLVAIDGMDKNIFSIGPEWYPLAQEFAGLIRQQGADIQVINDYGSRLFNLLVPSLVLESNRDRWVIVPDGLLNTIPFECLWYNDTYLVQSINISYAFSLAHRQATNTFRAAEDGVAVFAPSFDNSLAFQGRQLNPLKFNLEESEVIESHVRGATLFAGQSASLENFHTWAPISSVVHLSTHAWAGDADEDGLIIFEESDSYESLSQQDIYSLTIPAEMVVLSACETGTGEFSSGEGVMSFSRAFGAAGAKSVVASLWPANDGSTAKLMASFYEHLGENESKDVAISAAKREYLSAAQLRFQHPYYWAGFVAIGNMDAVTAIGRMPIKWLVIFGIAVVLGLVLVFIKLNRKPN